MEIASGDLEDLLYARSLLENPGLAMKITGFLGVPLEKGFSLLPKGWSDIVASSTRKALEAAFHSAVMTMHDGRDTTAANAFHKFMVAGTGAAGGFWGLPALVVELPVSTTLMMRSIADIARSEGQRITDPQVKIACLEVFAFGGPGKGDDAAETGYFAVRAALAKTVAEATKHIATRGLSEKAAPAFIRLLAQISSRFGIQVSEKIAAQAIPIIGAFGGAVINTLFMDHFQAMARGHFIILRLEKKYGADAVEREYQR
jgi:hypothetical protein